MEIAIIILCVCMLIVAFTIDEGRLAAFFSLAIVSELIYVVAHFVIKYW